MSGGNMEPMAFVRKFGTAKGGGEGSMPSRSLQSMANDQSRREQEFQDAANVDVSGVAIVKQAVTGACRSCGFPGHHAFQCYNTLMPLVKPESKPLVDVESTSSEDSDDDTAMRKENKKRLKKERKEMKKAKKEKKKAKKREKKEKKERKKREKERKRRHSSSSDSDSDSDSDRERKRRKKEKKRKERKRRHSSSDSSGSSSD